MTIPSLVKRRWSFLAAFIAGEAYSIYATFFAHALQPPDVHVTDRYTRRRLLPGQIGNLEVTVNWDDLIRILALSLVLFILVWCIMRLTAKRGHELKKQIVILSEENRQLTASMSDQGLTNAQTAARAAFGVLWKASVPENTNLMLKEKRVCGAHTVVPS